MALPIHSVENKTIITNNRYFPLCEKNFKMYTKVICKG